MENKQKQIGRKKAAKEKPVGDTPYTRSEWDEKIKEYFRTHEPHPWIKEFSGIIKLPKKPVKQNIADIIEEYYEEKAKKRK